MRMKGRFVARDAILESISTFEIIESYPDDKYLPSYLVYFRHRHEVFHAVFAAGVEGDNVRMITPYRPDPAQWSENLKKRNKP